MTVSWATMKYIINNDPIAQNESNLKVEALNKFESQTVHWTLKASLDICKYGNL